MEIVFHGVLLLVAFGNHGDGFLLQKSSFLHLWNRQVEIGAKTLRVTSGRRLSVTCDGTLAGPRSDPYLNWYGPDRHIIAHEGRHNRIGIVRSLSPRFKKLRFRRVQSTDSGTYICCSGCFRNHGDRHYRFFHLIVVGRHRERTTTIRSSTRLTESPTPRVVQTTEPVQTTREVQTTLVDQTTREVQTTLVDQTTREVQTTTQGAVNIVQTTTIQADNCTATSFRCGSGECFEATFRCDRFPDCQDGSDEAGCIDSQCLEGQFACVGRSPPCIQSNLVCNGEQNCLDGSDEAQGVCP